MSVKTYKSVDSDKSALVDVSAARLESDDERALASDADWSVTMVARCYGFDSALSEISLALAAAKAALRRDYSALAPPAFLAGIGDLLPILADESGGALGRLAYDAGADGSTVSLSIGGLSLLEAMRCARRLKKAMRRMMAAV